MVTTTIRPILTIDIITIAAARTTVIIAIMAETAEAARILIAAADPGIPEETEAARIKLSPSEAASLFL
jgi:hypothetical protein